MDKHWKTLSIKDRFVYTLSVCSFSLGWILVFVGFFVPPLGEISSSVLGIFGTSLIFTGSCLGISMHYENQLEKIKKEVDSRLNSVADNKLG